MSEMSAALTLMSALSVFIGVVIVISLINHQPIERKKDLNLLRLIGSD